MKHIVFALCVGIAGLPISARAHEETAHRGVPDTSIASSLPAAWSDPGGVRRALADRGIQFAVGYISDILSNPFGGVAQSTHYAGLVEASVDIEFERLRKQRYPCEKLLSAERDPEHSKPHQVAWLLKCSNAIYRVRLIPNRPAHVERID